VISTPVGGIPEIITDPRLGTLVPLESDKNTLVNRLIMEICGAKSPRRYDRSRLGDYFGSYSDASMFDGFEKAVMSIRGMG